jgi:hypothetical protein
MALPASGQLSFSEINTEFGLGTAMSAYRGATYYIGSTPGTFPSTNLSFNNFYSTAPTSPGASYQLLITTGLAGETSNVRRWEYNSASGWGSELSATGTNTPGTIQGMTFNSNRTQVVFAAFGSPYQAAYPYSSSGFGTKYSNPSTALPGAARGVSITPGDNAIAFGINATPWVQAYIWNNPGYGSKYANPSATLNNNGNQVRFTPSGSYLIVPTNTATSYCFAYLWNPGFGTRTALPASGWATSIQSVVFNPPVDNMLAGGSTSVSVKAYPWDESTKWGTAYSGPTLATGTNAVSLMGTAFNPAGNVAGAAFSNNAAGVKIYFSTWPFTPGSGFGTRYAEPASQMQSTAGSFSWTPDNLSIIIGAANASFGIGAYQWSDSGGYGTRFSNPSATDAYISRVILLYPL